jgi:hypothetical protein
VSTAGDACAVDDVRRTLGELADQIGVEDVALCSVKFGWSASSVCDSASRWRLSTATISFRSTKLARERRADEARAAGDDHAFALERHRASLAR